MGRPDTLAAMSAAPLEPRPSVVFLDLGDTLIRAHPSWSAVYRRVLADHGVDVGADELRAALDRTFGNNRDHVEGPFEASREASYERLKRFDTAVLTELGVAAPPDAFFRSLDAAFTERAAWWVFDDVPPALDALQAAGLRLAIISNWGWTAPELLHTLELARHFEALVISDRVGYLKPSEGIFRHALELMGVAAGDAVHVGDSRPADIEGARRVGMRAVLMDRDAAGAPQVPPDRLVPTVVDMWQLLDLLDVPRPSPATHP